MKKQNIAFNLLVGTLLCSSNVFAYDMAEIQKMIQERMQAAGMQGGMMPQMYPMQAPVQNTTPQVTITQEELSGKINALGTAPSFVQFDKRKEGFIVDQKAYIDPEGKIIKYGYDSFSGLVTYMAETVPGQYVIKTMQVKSDKEPVDIARANYQGGTWDVTTVTGKRITGNAIAMGSKGFTVSRESGAISFDPTTGLKTVALPEGYSVAEYQNGDITQTHQILLEAIPSEDKNDQVFGAFKALGSSLGLTKKQDYGLFNLDTGKVTFFNIASESKNRSECVQKERINSVFNKCQKSISYEALYDSVGLPNTGHYFWRVIWLSGATKKPISITIENGVKQLIATDLTTGKRVLLKERMMGINQFKVKQGNDGKIAVDVQLAFDHEMIDDVEKMLETLPAIQES